MYEFKNVYYHQLTKQMQSLNGASLKGAGQFDWKNSFECIIWFESWI